MTRQEYIERLVKLYKLKYKPSELEVEEFRLALEALPDNPIITFDPGSIEGDKGVVRRFPWPVEGPRVVMYGVAMPDSIYGDTPYTTKTSSTIIDEEKK